jgi:hypothetical protein
MADDKSFKELIAEQKKTNKLLEAQTRGDTEGANLKASIRNAAGEIVTELLVSKKQAGEHDQTQEQIEKSRKKRDTIAKQENVGDEARHEVVVDKLEEVVHSFNTTDFIGPPEPVVNKSKEKENQKDDRKALADAIDKSLMKGLGGLANQLKKLNPLKGGVGTFLKGLFGLALGTAALIGLRNFLNSEQWKDMQENLIPKLVIGLNFVTGILKNIGNRLLDLAVDLADPNKTMLDVVTENAGTISGFLAIFYAKSLLLFGGQLLKKAIVAGAVAIPKGAVAGMFSSLLLGFSKLVAPVLVAIGVAFSAYKGVRSGMDAYKEDGDLGNAIEEGMETFIATILGLIPDLLLDAVGFFVGLIAPELGKKIQDISVTEMIETALDDIQVIFDEMLPKLFEKITGGLNSFFHRATGGIFLGDEKKIQAKMMEDQKKLSKLNNEEFVGPLTPLDQARRESTIEAIEKDISKAAKSIERIQQFEKDVEYQKSIPDSKFIEGDESGFFGGGAYSGGLARAGESIMVGELGPELMIPKTDSQIFSARKSEELIMTALSRGVQASTLPRGGNGNLNFNPNNSGGGGGNTTINDNKIVNAPSSSVSTHTNVIRTVIEPDVYFMRQSGWAI